MLGPATKVTALTLVATTILPCDKSPDGNVESVGSALITKLLI